MEPIQSIQSYCQDEKFISNDGTILNDNFYNDCSSDEFRQSYTSSDDPNLGEDIQIMKMKYKQSQNKVYHDFYKTKMCPLYLLAICHKGNECPFAHSEEEIREKPNLVKTKLCEAFLKGSCTNKKCNFAHGEHELRSTPDLFKTAICNLWSQGKCQAGETCRFAHGLDDLRPAQNPKNNGLPLHHKGKKTQYNHIVEKPNYQKSEIIVPPLQQTFISMPIYAPFTFYSPQNYPSMQYMAGMQQPYMNQYQQPINVSNMRVKFMAPPRNRK